MLPIVHFLRGIGKQLAVEQGGLKGLTEPMDDTSSQHNSSALGIGKEQEV
jgi:hypothetical protein